jgi:hypothetical protein
LDPARTAISKTLGVSLPRPSVPNVASIVCTGDIRERPLAIGVAYIGAIMTGPRTSLCFVVRITLTQFLDFTTASGRGRLTQARRIKQQLVQDYNPATDYWKPLRDQVGAEFQRGWGGPSSLKRLRESSSDPKKQERYAECIEGLSQWTRKRKFGQSRRKAGMWTSGQLAVVVNPELVMDIDGTKTAIKLYLRSTKLTKPRVDTLLYLLKDALPGKVEPAILDVARGKLIQETVSLSDLDIVLEADAAQFMAMWNRL